MINQLPTELTEKILSNLDNESLIKFRQLNKKNNDICGEFIKHQLKINHLKLFVKYNTFKILYETLPEEHNLLPILNGLQQENLVINTNIINDNYENRFKSRSSIVTEIHSSNNEVSFMSDLMKYITNLCKYSSSENFDENIKEYSNYMFEITLQPCSIELIVYGEYFGELLFGDLFYAKFNLQTPNDKLYILKIKKTLLSHRVFYEASK